MKKLNPAAWLLAAALFTLSSCGDDDQKNDANDEPKGEDQGSVEYKGSSSNVNGLYLTQYGSQRVDGNTIYRHELDILSNDMSFTLDGEGSVGAVSGTGNSFSFRFFSDNDTSLSGSYRYNTKLAAGNFTLGTVIPYQNGQLGGAPSIMNSGRLDITHEEDDTFYIEAQATTDNGDSIIIKVRAKYKNIKP